MDIAQIAPILSTGFFVAGGAWGLGRWLWHRFEIRMSEGDTRILDKLNAMDIDHQADRADIKALQSRTDRLEGAQDVLVAIFAANAGSIVKPHVEGVSP